MVFLSANRPYVFAVAEAEMDSMRTTVYADCINIVGLRKELPINPGDPHQSPGFSAIRLTRRRER